MRHPRLPLCHRQGHYPKRWLTARRGPRVVGDAKSDGTPEAFARKSGILRQHCQEVGTDYEKISRSANYNIILGWLTRPGMDVH